MKLHYNRILQLLRESAGLCWLTCVMALKWLLSFLYYGSHNAGRSKTNFVDKEVDKEVLK